MTPAEVKTLQEEGKGRIVTREELGSFGLANIRGNNFLTDPFHLGEGP